MLEAYLGCQLNDFHLWNHCRLVEGWGKSPSPAFNSNHRLNKQLHIALGYMWLFNQRPLIATLQN